MSESINISRKLKEVENELDNLILKHIGLGGQEYDFNGAFSISGCSFKKLYKDGTVSFMNSGSCACGLPGHYIEFDIQDKMKLLSHIESY